MSYNCWYDGLRTSCIPFLPSFRLGPKIQGQVALVLNMALEPSRGLYLYCETLKAAFADEIVTDDEAQILRVLAMALGVEPGDATACSAVVAGEVPSPFEDDEDQFSGHRTGDVSTYQSALIAALDDEVITEDEWAMLDVLRGLMGLQPDQHAMIAQAVMMTAEVNAQGERRLERLERFLTLHPYR